VLALRLRFEFPLDVDPGERVSVVSPSSLRPPLLCCPWGGSEAGCSAGTRAGEAAVAARQLPSGFVSSYGSLRRRWISPDRRACSSSWRASRDPTESSQALGAHSHPASSTARSVGDRPPGGVSFDPLRNRAGPPSHNHRSPAHSTAPGTQPRVDHHDRRNWIRSRPPPKPPTRLRPPYCIRAAADAFLMQIACASCSPVRVMRVLHPADPPGWRNQATSHDLSKLGVAGSNPVRRSVGRAWFQEVTGARPFRLGASDGACWFPLSGAIHRRFLTALPPASFVDDGGEPREALRPLSAPAGLG